MDASDMKTSVLLLVHTSNTVRASYNILNCTCRLEYMWLNWVWRWGGGGEEPILFTPRCSLQCDRRALVQGWELLLCLIDNMLDGKLWLFSSRRKEEGEISTLVLSLLHTLATTSAQLSVSHSMEKLCRLTFWQWHNILDTVVARVCACCI